MAQSFHHNKWCQVNEPIFQLIIVTGTNKVFSALLTIFPSLVCNTIIAMQSLKEHQNRKQGIDLGHFKVLSALILYKRV